MYSTKLSTLLSRMDAYQTSSTVEEQYKVRALDEALRTLKRDIQLPWSIVHGTQRIFEDVLVYPVAADHDELAYLDNQDQNVGSLGDAQKAHFVYTSLQQFYEDQNWRNTIAEIWDRGTKYLGVRYNDMNVGSSIVDTASNVSLYSRSGDATAVALDNVMYKDGSSSIKVSITASAGTATITNTPASSSDANYKQKYYFRYVYLQAAPTSITMRYGNDASNYLYGTVTTQFSGQAFAAGDWNLIAFDLNNPTGTLGTINSNAFDYEAIIFTGASSGTYYINYSYLRGWQLFDYWYYSNYNCITVGGTIPNQAYFYNDSEVYSIDTSLVGDKEWTDVIMFDGLLTVLRDAADTTLADTIKEKRDTAWNKLYENYPSMKPVIITQKYMFNDDYTNQYDQLP